MRVMLPPQNGVTPHMTSDYGPRTLNGRQDHHGGADFNYRGGQAGLNLQHPTVRSPVSGEVVFSGGQYGTVKIRDGEGNLHEILHLDSRSVQVTNPATRVQAGDPIGTMGGRGPNGAGQYAQHVHYQIRDPSGRTVDPEGFWDGRTVEGPARPTTEARAPRSEAMADGVLRQGERGAEVVAAQQALNQLGYTGRNGQPLETRSGIYGAETRHAVEDFQRRHGLKPDGLIGDDTRAAMATAAQRPLLSEATHPNHRLYTEIARQLPPGTRPEVAANVTLQALENGITSPDRLARVDVRGNDVFVMGSTPGDRVKVDLNAPTPGMQQMSDHTRQQSQQAQPMPTRTQEPVQTGDTEVLRPRTMLA
jgi:putative chitinase